MSNFSIKKLSTTASLCLIVLFPVSNTTYAQKPEGAMPPTFKKYVEPWVTHGVMEPTREGKLQMVLDVNADGTIADWLVISSDYEQFIEAVNRVIDQWEFNPAMLNGEPIPMVFKLEFEFSKRGASLIQGNVSSIYLEQFTDLFRESRYVRSFDELDRLPQPIEIVRPVINIDTPEKDREGRVVVSFYIDRTGTVRIPIVENFEGSQAIADAAYNAILQWKFEPPTVKGKPVTVQVRQPFNFLPSKDNQ